MALPNFGDIPTNAPIPVPARGTSLPASPTDGQITFFDAGVSAGGTADVVWQLRYRAASARWEFVGGSELINESDAATSICSTAWVSQGNPAAPTLTAPRVGVYILEHGGSCGGDQITSNFGMQAVFNAGVFLGYSDIVFSAHANWASGLFQGSRKTPVVVASANTVLDVRNANSNGNCVSYQKRWMSLRPMYVT